MLGTKYYTCLCFQFRIFTAPFHHVGFADFWLADQLNSLVTVLLDFEFMACFYTFEVDWLGPDSKWHQLDWLGPDSKCHQDYWLGPDRKWHQVDRLGPDSKWHQVDWLGPDSKCHQVDWLGPDQ